MMSSASINEILNFWFDELSRKDWFRKDEALDSTIASRFGTIYHQLRSGVPPSWLDTPEGIVAAILVPDQFPRNMFRSRRALFRHRRRGAGACQAGNIGRDGRKAQS